MIEQKSTPDPELLNQIAKEYEISKKFLGTAKGMSELEAEVDLLKKILLLISYNFPFYPTLLSKLMDNNFCASTANSIGNLFKTSFAYPFTISPIAPS